eukprot:CAMPEP_0170179162 /NCGR_PEP_ID=MMETSP0040_2-20121228/16442_1 /TAXON_ID=641309 /ORGANISM="Lotharella oceanica, Strain CCMP622" /LENGTH=195 /DNA_ID=CAMNT_0010423033 /DNA_START=127 /DNA_END=714 /DNA_ORIENTATION=-
MTSDVHRVAVFLLRCEQCFLNSLGDLTVTGVAGMAPVLPIRTNPVARDQSFAGRVPRCSVFNRTVFLEDVEQINGRGKFSLLSDGPDAARQTCAGEKRVDHGLVHVVLSVLIERRRDHNVHLRSGRQALKDVDHIQIVSRVLRRVWSPVVVLGVIGAQHQDHDVRIAVEDCLIFSGIPIGVVSVLEHCSPVNAKI